jgi:hypothetical protein
MKFIATALLVFFSVSSFATTWSKTKVNDPILKGEKCSVNEPMSYGSYIYQMPSKYDQVFWPLTDPNGIWFCEKSGYVSFMDDFEKLTAKEKLEISKYLKGKKLKNLTTNEILLRLEEIYALRDLNPEAKNLYLRVFGQWYQNSGDILKANQYRKTAFENIETQLKTNLAENTKLEYLYLASNYSRLFNNVKKSEDYLASLDLAIKNLKNKEYSDLAEYLKELSKELRNTSPNIGVKPKTNEKK